MKVTVQEFEPFIGGQYQARGILLDIPAVIGLHTFDYSWPMPISLLSAEFGVANLNIGDSMEVHVAPDTVIGAIAQDVTASDTIIYVSQTVLDNIAVGRFLKIADGTNTDNLGRVISIDKADGTVTVETAAVNNFLASSPTYVKMTTKMVADYEFGVAQRFTLGNSKIGGSTIPANKPLRFVYNNKDGLAKTFATHVEYLY